MAIANIEAIIFDMDGTLVDSELLTQKAVQRILAQNQVSAGKFDFTQCYGITWKNIEGLLWDHFPTISAIPLAATLEDLFYKMVNENKPDPIKGAKWAVQEANRVAKTAIGIQANVNLLMKLLSVCSWHHSSTQLFPPKIISTLNRPPIATYWWRSN